MTLTVNECFSGIGAQSAALKRLGIDFEVVGIAEIDKYAIKSYEAIHGPARNYGDISKVGKLDYADFWTYSFPCQDISVAGNGAGIKKGETRSGLLYEVERLLEKSMECGELPKYLMLENVKNLVGKRFKPQFDEWISRLDELGYNTYWKVLNAKNYGIPQNRERVFAISIRKDVDFGYEFPQGFDNGKRLKDVLESEVDEKFYLPSEKARLLQIPGNVNAAEYPNTKFVIDKSCNNPRIIEYANCLTAREDRGVSNHKQEGTAVLEFPCIAASRGRNPENPSDRTVGAPTEQRIEINWNGTSNTITTVQKDNYVIESPYRIRKLTPLECWRLMGFSDEDFRKAEAVNSNAQLYKQAGNSIVVDVLYYQFRNLFKEHHTAKIIYMDNSDQLEGQMNIYELMAE